jgi:AraC family transcriptional regulator
MRGQIETVRSHGPINVLSVLLPATVFRAAAHLDMADLEPSSGMVDSRLQRLMLLIEEERRLGFPAGALFLDASCHALASLLVSLRGSKRASRSAVGTKPMQTVRDAIIDHLDEPKSLAELALLVGVSTATLSREFRRSFGVSPHRFALEQRIQRCMALLRTTSASVTDIALATGFQTPQHMATVFKRFTGTSPSQFRLC